MQFRKIMVAVTEDWFVLSHFKPLLRALGRVADEVVVATRVSGLASEIEALGCRVVAFDFRRASANPIVALETSRRFAALMRAEAPDALHLVALKPITIGATALRLTSVRNVGVHVTGLGLLSVASGMKSTTIHTVTMRILRSVLRRDGARLFLENPDDRDTLSRSGIIAAQRAVILGGAGIDPVHFAVLPPPKNTNLRVAHVGRMIKSKGIDVLVEAIHIARGLGAGIALDLYGGIDQDNTEKVALSEIEAWQAQGLARWHGHVRDVREVWRKSDVYVLATRGGEGLPRALLEAAACGRPSIVTDVAGCRRFVRDGIEGLVVPPNDPPALARALQQLAADRDRRESMGLAARSRVLESYTEQHVVDAIVSAYRAR
jgi:glycosyltransferase involved in cell wall biosynthesis